LYLSLYGEVQKEVIQETLAHDFGIEVEFRETTTIYIERPISTGEAAEFIRQPPNPFLATVGLRVEPAPISSGVQFRLAAEVHGTMPAAFFLAVEQTVYDTLRQGIYGWQVTDCTVTMTHSGYAGRHSLGHQPFNKSMSSTGWDFRYLTPLVLMSALQRAGIQVYEPLQRFRIEAPADTLGSIVPALTRLGAVPQTSALRGSACLLEGEIPATRVHDLEQQLQTLTRGESVLEAAFARYQPVRGAIPTRPRTDRDPLHRKEYLLHVMRRV
jgi:ribosomal protection tetracycline resistance protein